MWWSFCPGNHCMSANYLHKQFSDQSQSLCELLKVKTVPCGEELIHEHVQEMLENSWGSSPLMMNWGHGLGTHTHPWRLNNTKKAWNIRCHPDYLFFIIEDLVVLCGGRVLVLNWPTLPIKNIIEKKERKEKLSIKSICIMSQARIGHFLLKPYKLISTDPKSLGCDFGITGDKMVNMLMSSF